MMSPKQSEAEFRKRIGDPLDGFTAFKGIAAMIAFYSEQRAQGVVVEEDGDMLLFQWGTTPVEPEEFYVNITRQFIHTDQDEPYQLSLSFYFPATTSLASLKSGNRWCQSPDGIAELSKFLASSPAIDAVGSALPKRVELGFAMFTRRRLPSRPKTRNEQPTLVSRNRPSVSPSRQTATN